MLSLLVLGLYLSSVLAHPQCLDFYPPFELPSDSHAFCDGYKDFGCCTLAQNEAIQERYQTLKRNLPESAAHECRNFLKDILCQECSPYAAHLFDAETTHRKTSLPGLCGAYCSSLYNTCPELIPVVTDDAAIIDAYSTSESAFCAEVEIGDMDYCYPNILQDTFLDDLAWAARTGGGDGCLCFEEFANGLRNPILAVHANDSTHRLFIAEQVGIVHVYLRNGTRLNDPFLDIQDTVRTSSRRGDERGFLGLAFHPNFISNSRLFVYYSTLSSSESEIIRISEFQTMSNDSNRVNVTTERVILDVEQPAGNHNGGQMLFDDQGYFYAFLGDGGRGGDPFGQYGNAQNLAELLGSVIRIDVDQQQEGLAYAIPPDNPYISYSNSERRHEIYAYGTRNMWRCSIDQGDRQTGEGRGRIFCGDVGQSSYEEIDIIEKGGNYGWRGKEGFSCYDNTMCNDFLENEVLPIHVYPHTVGKCVIGGYVYRGCQYPNLNGKYIFGDYVSGRLFELNENTATQEWNSREFCLGDNTVCTGSMLGAFPKNILSFGEDEAGEIYILSTSEAKTTVPQGKVFKIVDPRKRGNPEECLKDIRDVDVDDPTTPFDALGPTTPFDVHGPTTPFDVHGPTTPFDVHGPTTPIDIHGSTTPFDVHGPTTPGDVHGPTTPFDVHGPTTPFDVYDPTTPIDVHGSTTPFDVHGPTTPFDVHGPTTPGDVRGPTTPFEPSLSETSRCPKKCKGEYSEVGNTTYCDAKFGTVRKAQRFNNSCRCPNLEVGHIYFILGDFKSSWQKFILKEYSIVKRYDWHHAFMIPRLNEECRGLTMNLFTKQFG